MRGPLQCAVAILCTVLACIAGAQPYPTKPVRVIVTFPPGAGSDIATRLVSAKLTETLGWQFVVDNRAGAAGNIGVELAAHAAADGYTLLSVTASAAISQSAYSKVSFDLKRAKNGQGEYSPHPWKPRESIRMFSDAAWFRPEYGVLAAKLAGQPGETFFNWQMVLNAVQSRSLK